MKKNGFSLIEMLITLSIIAVIIAVGFSVFGNVMRNNRDQRRELDLQTIAKALELYRQDQRGYPSVTDFVVESATNLQSANNRTYLDSVPRDPDSTRNYKYAAFNEDASSCSGTGTKCAKFILCALKEGSGSSNMPSGCSLQICNGASTACNMGLASP